MKNTAVEFDEGNSLQILNRLVDEFVEQLALARARVPTTISVRALFRVQKCWPHQLQDLTCTAYFRQGLSERYGSFLDVPFREIDYESTLRSLVIDWKAKKNLDRKGRRKHEFHITRGRLREALDLVQSLRAPEDTPIPNDPAGIARFAAAIRKDADLAVRYGLDDVTTAALLRVARGELLPELALTQSLTLRTKVSRMAIGDQIRLLKEPIELLLPDGTTRLVLAEKMTPREAAQAFKASVRDQRGRPCQFKVASIGDQHSYVVGRAAKNRKYDMDVCGYDKYAGKKWKWVCENDPDYIRYLANDEECTPTTRKFAEALCERYGLSLVPDLCELPKYRGKTWEWVAKNDPGYLRFLASKKCLSRKLRALGGYLIKRFCLA
jgi:hypothetical protein